MDKSLKEKIVRKGFSQAMDGNELWINTEDDQLVKMVVKNTEKRWDLYCRPVTITFEFGEREKK